MESRNASEAIRNIPRTGDISEGQDEKEDQIIYEHQGSSHRKLLQFECREEASELTALRLARFTPEDIVVGVDFVSAVVYEIELGKVLVSKSDWSCATGFYEEHVSECHGPVSCPPGA